VSETWFIYDFVTRQDKPSPKDDPNEPTEAWVQGWNACMHDGYGKNPYDESTQEHHDWQEGWEAAERD
jgi:hypothetical protein